MRIVYSNQPPDFRSPSIFLAGPAPRSAAVVSWRIEALQLLEAAGFPGDVLVPEHATYNPGFDYMEQVEWEYTCLEGATIIAFWVPRDRDILPGFTTNVEFGRYVNSGRCVYGRPDSAPKNQYLDWLYEKLTGQTPLNSLPQTMQVAASRSSARE